ncbi:photoreceptor cilium actin regulator [Sebastes umbrosus]|uniref:photoreceptor cilium actin regulator n=1 Tax=Sebastes umbrosus TaxID=72105 RepID=UPI00189DDDA5|nr:photoreceptor cilium actin regulator [Sebastes umbrosus]
MGCSPSKGKLFSKPEGPGPQKVLLVEERQNGPQKAPLAEAPQDGDDSRPEEEKGQYLEANEKENDELPLPIEELTTKETSWCQLASDTTGAQNAEDVEETEVNVMPQEVVHEVVQTDTIKKVEKRKKNKGKRRSNEKQRRSSIVKTKLDFAPHMVRAHQAAYAFLNPNISKYEALLGLLDQAAQTQLSLKPTMSAFVLRFEEINQAVEEMAEEGEFMLKEHGDYMALHSGMMGTDFMPTKPRTDTANPPNPPPDLLKQLLQHSTEKMRLVGGSAQALGDTTLMEAVEYFSSVSERLVEKLQAKQAAEHRLALVLARVEQAAMRKSNPEDSALHSEDSGIGGENESLTGSERSRRHRESAGSGSCGSGSNICDDTLPSNLLNLVGYHKDDEEDEEEGDDDHEEYEDDEGDGPEMKRSNSSPPDPSQPCLVMSVNYMQDQQPTVKRPLTAVTATKSEYSSSTDIMMELQKIQKNLDQRMKKMAEIRGKKELAGPHYNLYRAGLRRHSASGSADAQKGLFRTSQSPGPLPRLAPQPPKHQSVRGLINTFSQGVDGRPGQSLANIPPHIRRPRKSQLSDRVNGNEGGLVINGNNNNNRWPEGRDDLDEDNLPPPPPEVMMDDSFQSTEDIPGNKEGSREDLVLPIINQKAGVSQRLKASVQNVEVLPNRANMVPRSISFLPIRQDAVMGAQEETDLDPEMERVKCLYQKARKMIHLCNTGESHDKRDTTELSGRVTSPLQARMGQRSGSTEFYEGEMSSYSLPVTAPPVSRVRLPPSCPSVCHRYPHPPAYRSQSASRPSSRPSSPRTVTRATDNNEEEIIPSVSFRDARSVFCRKDSETCSSSGSSVLPKLSRGRLPTRGIDDSTRRTQSEQRPCLTSHSEFSKDGCSATTQANGE